MPKPAHIPQSAWDKAQELLKTAPDMWIHDICAGTFIGLNGEVEGDDEYEDDVFEYEDDGDYEWDEDEDDYDEDAYEEEDE